MDSMLLIDCCLGSGVSMELSESTTNRGLTKFRGKFQEAEAINKNKRSYPFGILDENVHRLQEAIKERKLVGELDHPCLLSDDFEVLTPKGWKPFRQIRIGDEVYSRVNGQMTTSKVLNVIDQPYDGKAYHVKGRSIDCQFTAPHKFIICDRKGKEEYVTIDEIHKNRTKYSHYSIPKTAQWKGIDKTHIVIPGAVRKQRKECSEALRIETHKFVEFLGLYLAEGSLKKQKKSNRIEICQKTDYGKKIVRHLLSDFHPEIEWKESKNGFYTSDPRLYDYLLPLGNKYQKHIPEEIKSLSGKYLEKLVMSFAIGDGRMLYSEDNAKTCKNIKQLTNIDLVMDQGNFSRVEMFSVSERLIDDLHECIVKTGWSATRSVVEDEKDYQFAGREIKACNKKPLHCIHVSRCKSIHLDTRFLKTVEKHHTGNIFCLTTENGNFYMKHKGKSFWTGNCDSVIHFANCSHVITRLWWEGHILMGEGEILNTPHGKILRALIEDGVKVGISSRGVGNGKVNEDGILVIGEGYKLITFDAVADPSTFEAYQQKVVGSRRESVVHVPVNQTPVSQKTVIKNEDSSIYTINKDALIACLGGIVKSQTQKFKSRLG